MVPGSLGWGSVVLAAITTLAPSAPHRIAIASPMPRLPPVMKIVFPFKMLITHSSFGSFQVVIRGTRDTLAAWPRFA